MDALFSLMEKQYPTFSKGQRRIAEYILNSYDDAAFMTAAKLGERVGVSESTVVRFAYKLGLDCYPALQEALQDLIRHRLTSVGWCSPTQFAKLSLQYAGSYPDNPLGLSHIERAETA